MLENQNLLSRCKWVVPPNLGWLNYSLDDKEIDYLWKSIENKKDNIKDVLAGNISKSFELEDINDWFFNSKKVRKKTPSFFCPITFFK